MNNTYLFEILNKESQKVEKLIQDFIQKEKLYDIDELINNSQKLNNFLKSNGYAFDLIYTSNGSVRSLNSKMCLIDGKTATYLKLKNPFNDVCVCIKQEDTLLVSSVEYYNFGNDFNYIYQVNNGKYTINMDLLGKNDQLLEIQLKNEKEIEFKLYNDVDSRDTAIVVKRIYKTMIDPKKDINNLNLKHLNDFLSHKDLNIENLFIKEFNNNTLPYEIKEHIEVESLMFDNSITQKIFKDFDILSAISIKDLELKQNYEPLKQKLKRFFKVK